MVREQNKISSLILHSEKQKEQSVRTSEKSTAEGFLLISLWNTKDLIQSVSNLKKPKQVYIASTEFQSAHQQL